MLFGTRAVVLLGVCGALSAAETDTFFESKVRPLLAKNCYGCHTQTALGGLRLDSGEAALKGGKSGPAIVPGKPAESLLMQAVTHRHERLKMPPSGKLADADIAVLTEWIEKGAVWPAEAKTVKPASGEYRITAEQRAFWSFQPVKAPELPKFANAAWAKGAIDRFVLAALEAKGIQPSAPADPRTLIRRATFDLTGLPPTPEEVDAFVRDKSPDAFAKVVDRLLASRQYGEKWARHWLDVARYSDDSLSPTLSAARYPNSWRYRNWVIDAFNKDLPYNVFVKAQIAGDLLPSKDPNEFTPGLGMYALSPEMQDDRVDVTTRGFLGLTVACAQCHDHKFDPIPTKDYYSLQGVFASTQMDEVPLAAKDVVEAWQSHDRKIKKQQETIDEFYKAQRQQLGAILASRTARYLLAAQGVDSADGLDEETVERWRQYLKRPRREYAFLDKWMDLVAKGAPAEALRAEAAVVQATAIAVNDEKREVDQKNVIILGGKDPDALGNPNAALVSLPVDRYLFWRDLFERAIDDSSGYFKTPEGVYYYGPGKIDRWLQGSWKEYVAEQKAELAKLRAALPAKYAFLQTIKDREKPSDVRIQIRGDRGNLGDVAPRRFLAILAGDERKHFANGAGRLELAEAITDPRNPLTARVIVNRLWGWHFGRGIVATSSNFGQMGERPTHPELLDYLADSLVKKGWSLKALHREILLSGTYQLSAVPTPTAAEKDPANVYLSHANRRRLEAEPLRDSMLFVSGMLDAAPGELAKPLDASNRKRTVYGVVSRRKLDPMLATFDFPNPNSTSEGRMVTNVPLQRLFFMNSAFVEEAAAAFAKRFEGDADTRVRRMYRAAYHRDPDAAELRDGVAFANASGWTGYARVLLGANEFYYVD